MMNRHKRILALTTAAVLSAFPPAAAFADSPEFAYDEATWARLRDNVMEYDELPMLVEEYNPTYLNNQTSYRDNRTRDNAREMRDKQLDNANDAYDAAENLRSQAEDMRDQAEALLGDPYMAAGMSSALPSMASAYSGLMSAAAMTEQGALRTEQSAKASYVDSEMESLDYQNNQKALIVQTQGLFASYNLTRKSVAAIAKNIELSQASLGALERQVQIGMATQAELLNARQALQTVQSTFTQTQATLESLRQQLCMMTGWQYNDQPEIQDLPRANQARIDAMNPDADSQAALENNLKLKYNRRALSNMSDGSADKKNMERTIQNQEETIRANVRNLYNDALQKRIALQLAEAALAAENTSMNAANTKYQLGMISNLEYIQAQSSLLGKQIELETADMNLQQAIETYEWALKGYMN